MSQQTMSIEAKAAVIANLELEINARKEKLRAMCEAQCASLRSRLERRVNRIPATKRQMPLVDLLNASLPAPPKAVPTKAVPAKAPPAKRAAAKEAPSKDMPPPAPPARKTRAAPATTTTKAAPIKDEPKSAPKPATTRAAPKQTAVKETTKTTATRTKKRGSDEISGEDKENATDLAVPKKRARAPPKATAAPKPAAPTTRTTRAASRTTKAAPAQVLSPKNNNTTTARSTKPARSTRPR